MQNERLKTQVAGRRAEGALPARTAPPSARFPVGEGARAETDIDNLYGLMPGEQDTIDQFARAAIEEGLFWRDVHAKRGD